MKVFLSIPVRKFSQLIFLLGLLYGILNQCVYAQVPAPLLKIPTTNGEVYCVTHDDTYTYVGGSFSLAVPNASPEKKQNTYAIRTSVLHHNVDPNFASVNGNVYTVVSDDAGGWFIGGDFTNVGGLPRNRIAHILASGAIDTLWNPNASHTVYVLAKSGDVIFAGGMFTEIGGLKRNYLAKLSSRGVGEIDKIWDPRTHDPYVGGLAIYGNDLLVAGAFSGFRGTNTDKVVKISTTGVGLVDSMWQSGISGYASAGKLAIKDSSLFVEGFFGWYGTGNRSLLKVHLNGNGQIDTSWNTFFYRTNAIAIDDSNIFAATGNSVFKISINKNATIDTSWKVTVGKPWMPNQTDPITSLAIQDGYLYIGGDFTVIGKYESKGSARVSTRSGAIDTAWKPAPIGRVYSLAVKGQDVFIGGLFPSIIGIPRNNVFRFVTSTGLIDTLWNPNADWHVYSMAVRNNEVFAGGYFSRIGGRNRKGIAKLSTLGSGVADSIWNPRLNAAWNPNVNSTVYSLGLRDNNIFIGGSFDSVNGLPRTRIAKISTVGIGGVDTLWNSSVKGNYIKTLLVDSISASVFIGGQITEVGGLERNAIAKIFSEGRGAVDTRWNAPIAIGGGSVEAMTLKGGSLYVGGIFSNYSYSLSNLAKISKDGDGAIDGAWKPAWMGYVWSIASTDNDVYVGGPLTSIGDQRRNHLAKISTMTSGIVDSQWNPNVSGEIITMDIKDSILYFGGMFSSVGNDLTRKSLAAVSLNGIQTRTSVQEWDKAVSGEISQISPNPTEGELRIGGTGLRVVNVYDMSGAAVLEERITTGIVDIHFLSTGVYMVVVKSSDGRIVHKQMIKR